MTPEELLEHFQKITLPYDRMIPNQPFLKQESLIEELFKLVKKDFLLFTSNHPEAGEKWLILDHVFYSILLGIVEDKNYNELKPNLKKFSHAVVDSITDLQE